MTRRKGATEWYTIEASNVRSFRVNSEGDKIVKAQYIGDQENPEKGGATHLHDMVSGKQSQNLEAFDKLGFRSKEIWAIDTSKNVFRAADGETFV